MQRLPFFNEVERGRNILIAGAGGGFDVFCGLPLYFGLRETGKDVHLANLTFSQLPSPEVVGEARLSGSMLKVTADTPAMGLYFPEKFLAQWFRQQGLEVPVYCFESTGVKPLRASYEILVRELAIDTIILVDGGTDSLMRGDEAGLGTPAEDMASIAAVHELTVERKLLVCLGFGVDHFHGVCQAHFLEATAELTRSGGYLGMFSLVEEMPEVRMYRGAVEAVFKAMPRDISIVNSSILAALSGRYGDHHETRRTRGNELWINPLMPVYWCFQLEAVARRVLYLNAIKETVSHSDVTWAISAFQDSCTTIRPRKPLPL